MKELHNPFTALLSKLQARRAQKKKNKEMRNAPVAVPSYVAEDTLVADPAAILEAEDTLRRLQLTAICTATAPKRPSPSTSPSPPPSTSTSTSPSPPAADPLAALAHDLLHTTRRLRSLQTRHLSATIPWLPHLPDTALHIILIHAGPHTRRVCRRFRSLHSPPPAALRPCPLHTTTPPSQPPADALLTLSCLPTVTTLDLRAFPQLDPDAATAAIATPTALHHLYLACPLQPPHLAALLPHAPTLRSLAPLSLRTGPPGRYPTPDDLTLLSRFTALRALHVYEWRTPLRLAPLHPLTTLTALTFPLLACMGSKDNHMSELLTAAAHLPLLRDLRLPGYNIAWDPPTAQLLGTFTRLATLHVGNGQVHPPEDIRTAMVAALACLTALTDLHLVEPIRWTTAAALPALAPLPLRSLAVGMYCEHGADTVTNEERGAMVAVLARQAALTSLVVERAPLDVVVEAAAGEPCRGRGGVQNGGGGEQGGGENWAGGGGCYHGAGAECDVGRRGERLAMDVVLGSLRGSLAVLELKHCIVPPGLFESLGGMAGLRRLLVNYCWWRDDPQSDSEELAVPYTGLGRLTGLTSLTLRSSAPFEAPLQELTCLTGLQELALPQWRQQAAELWALVPLRELRALTVCQTFDAGDDEGRPDVCAVLQHCVSLRKVAVMGSAENSLQSCCLFQDDILRLAQGAC